MLNASAGQLGKSRNQGLEFRGRHHADEPYGNALAARFEQEISHPGPQSRRMRLDELDHDRTHAAQHGVDERLTVLRNTRRLEMHVDDVDELVPAFRKAREKEEGLPVGAPLISRFRKHTIECRPLEFVGLGERAVSANQKGLQRHNLNSGRS